MDSVVDKFKLNGQNQERRFYLIEGSIDQVLYEARIYHRLRVANVSDIAKGRIDAPEDVFQTWKECDFFTSDGIITYGNQTFITLEPEQLREFVPETYHSSSFPLSTSNFASGGIHLRMHELEELIGDKEKTIELLPEEIKEADWRFGLGRKYKKWIPQNRAAEKVLDHLFRGISPHAYAKKMDEHPWGLSPMMKLFFGFSDRDPLFPILRPIKFQGNNISGYSAAAYSALSFNASIFSWGKIVCYH